MTAIPCEDCGLTFPNMRKCKRCDKTLCMGCINITGYVGSKYEYNLDCCDYCYAKQIEQVTKLGLN